MRTLFLSSTSRDLHECRQAVYQAIEGLEGYHCVRMEDFGSWDSNPDDLCSRMVANCDVFVILAGEYYGSVAPQGGSYTEREYRTAHAAGKPCLVFLTADDFAGPSPDEPEEMRARQQSLRSELGAARVVSRFSDPQDAAIKVMQAVRNWEASGRGGSASTLRLSIEGSTVPAREFGDPFVGIGRGPSNAFAIADPQVSWEHGQIIRMLGQYYYRHLSGTNSTIIQRRGQEIRLLPGEAEPAALLPQDRLSIGGATLIVDFDLVRESAGYSRTAPRPGK